MYDKENPPKFPMHDLHHAQTIKNCVTAVIVAVSASTLVYLFYNLPRRAAYRDFYSNYDPIASFDRMVKAGVLSSCPPGGDDDKDKKDDKKGDKKK